MAAFQRMPDEIKLQIFDYVFSGLRVAAVPPSAPPNTSVQVPPPTGGLAIFEIPTLATDRSVYEAFARSAMFIVGSEDGLSTLRQKLGSLGDSVTLVEISTVRDWSRRECLPRGNLDHPSHNISTLRTAFQLLPRCAEVFPRLQHVDFREYISVTRHHGKRVVLWIGDYSVPKACVWAARWSSEDDSHMIVSRLETYQALRSWKYSELNDVVRALGRCIRQQSLTVGYHVEMKMFRRRVNGYVR